MLVLIDNYDSFTYNLVQYFYQLGVEVRVVRNDQCSIESIEAMRPTALCISPGPGRPENAGITMRAIVHFSEYLPILGVCLGHQAIAQHFGARIIHAPAPVHGKTSRIRHEGKGLFAELPRDFDVCRYHSLCVDEASLPECLSVTARSCDGVIMGFAHRSLPIHGVQFHPEAILTEHGHRLLQNFLGCISTAR